MLLFRLTISAAALGLAVPASTQTATSQPPAPAQFPEPVLLDPPLRIPAPGGEVVIATEGEKRQYDEIKFAAARRAGDFVTRSRAINRLSAAFFKQRAGY